MRNPLVYIYDQITLEMSRKVMNTSQGNINI